MLKLSSGLCDVPSAFICLLYLILRRFNLQLSSSVREEGDR